MVLEGIHSLRASRLMIQLMREASFERMHRLVTPDAWSPKMVVRNIVVWVVATTTRAFLCIFGNDTKRP
jgi:hypothetical protein